MTQIKVETTIYHFNSIYKGEKESKKRSVERMKERENKRERMRRRDKVFCFYGCSLHEV